MYEGKPNSIISLPKILAMIFLIGGALLIHACTSTQDSVKVNNNGNNNLGKGEEAFAFYDTTGGQETYWKAVFKDHKLNQLYKNGIQLPDSLIPDYKDLVYNRIDNVTGFHTKFKFRIHDLPFDSTFFNQKMKPFKDHLMWVTPDSCYFNFDNKNFHLEMDSLNKKLKKLKHFNFDFKFDSLKFNDEMKEMMKSLKHIHFDSSGFRMNMKEFEKNMKEFQREMKNKKFDMDIDLSGLDHQMDSLDKQLHVFKLDLSGVNKELKKYHKFEKELKKEMLKDGIIKNDDESLKISVGSNSISVNGKKLPDKLVKKYKKLYKDMMGEEWDNERHYYLR